MLPALLPAGRERAGKDMTLNFSNCFSPWGQSIIQLASSLVLSQCTQLFLMRTVVHLLCILKVFRRMMVHCWSLKSALCWCGNALGGICSASSLSCRGIAWLFFCITAGTALVLTLSYILPFIKNTWWNPVWKRNLSQTEPKCIPYRMKYSQKWKGSSSFFKCSLFYLPFYFQKPVVLLNK